MNYKIFLIISLFIPKLLVSQLELIHAGPMPGYSEMREVPIWLQTKKACTVQAIYWLRGHPDSIFHTNQVRTTKEKAFTAVFLGF